MDEGLVDRSIKIYGEFSENPICEIVLREEEEYICGFDCLNEACIMLESMGIFQNVNVQLMKLCTIDNQFAVLDQDEVKPGMAVRLHSKKGKRIQSIEPEKLKPVAVVEVHLFKKEEYPLKIAIHDPENCNLKYVADRVCEIYGKEMGYYKVKHMQGEPLDVVAHRDALITFF